MSSKYFNQILVLKEKLTMNEIFNELTDEKFVALVSVSIFHVHNIWLILFVTNLIYFGSTFHFISSYKPIYVKPSFLRDSVLSVPLYFNFV